MARTQIAEQHKCRRVLHCTEKVCTAEAGKGRPIRGRIGRVVADRLPAPPPTGGRAKMFAGELHAPLRPPVVRARRSGWGRFNSVKSFAPVIPYPSVVFSRLRRASTIRRGSHDTAD